MSHLHWHGGSSRSGLAMTPRVSSACFPKPSLQPKSSYVRAPARLACSAELRHPSRPQWPVIPDGEGTALVDAGGEKNLYKRANPIRALGYKTLALRDADVPPNQEEEEHFLASGGKLVTWRHCVRRRESRPLERRRNAAAGGVKPGQWQAAYPEGSGEVAGGCLWWRATRRSGDLCSLRVTVGGRRLGCLA